MKDKLSEMAKFLQEQLDRMHALKSDRFEYACFYKASMNHIFRVDDLIGVTENGEINLMMDHATHKIIGLYSTIGCEVMEFVLLDLITNELFELKL